MRRSYNVENFWSTEREPNNLCNAMSDLCADMDEPATRQHRELIQRAYKDAARGERRHASEKKATPARPSKQSDIADLVTAVVQEDMDSVTPHPTPLISCRSARLGAESRRG